MKIGCQCGGRLSKLSSNSYFHALFFWIFDTLNIALYLSFTRQKYCHFSILQNPLPAAIEIQKMGKFDSKRQLKTKRLIHLTYP